MSDEKPNGRKLSRSDLFRVTGAAGAGLALGAGGHTALGRTAGARDRAAAGPKSQTVAFHDVHQAGIATAQQEHLHFAALDLVTEGVSEVRDLLRA
jgi:deferrochelatase/peroxidase EfeB